MEKMTFKTQYSRTGERFYTDPGSPVVKKYSSKIDKDGNLVVFEDGEKDLYGYIQSFEESTNIQNIMKKFTNGDLSVLETRQGEFIDLTKMPENFFDMMNSYNKGIDLFNELPSEVKDKFGNDAIKFISTIGSDEWMNNLGIGVASEEPKQPAVESEVN